MQWTLIMLDAQAMPNTYVTATTSWDAVFEDFLPRVLNFFRYRVDDVQLAEDLCAMTFERAWSSRHRYNSRRGAVSTWLFTIARRVLADHLRKHRPVSVSLAAVELVDEASPEDSAQRNADATKLIAMLHTLTADDRELIALKYGADMTNREIASVMGISESNVGTRLHRLIQKLRVAWEEPDETR